MSPAWHGCADRARQRLDPMIGSAPYARGWLLIEHTGPWAVDALVGSGIERTVLRAVSAAAVAADARILLIRRPGRRKAGRRPRAWFAIGPARSVHGSWHADTDLLTAASAARSLAAEQRLPAPMGEPLILVCTHAIHDACCAVRGRPVAAALHERWPDLVWECSHLGGDRFAPNVVVLPDAAYYGNLDADSSVGVMSDHLAGRLDVRWLRGLARFQPPAQTAIAEIHRRFGPLPASSVLAEKTEQLDAHRWEVQVTAPGGWWLGGRWLGGRWLVSVIAERRPPAVLTCRAGSATPATAYRVTELANL